MTSSELLEAIDELLNALDDNKFLMQTLKTLSAASSTLVEKVANYLKFGDPNSIHNYNEQQKTELRKTIEPFKDINPFDLAKGIDAVTQDLVSFAKKSQAGGDEFLKVYSGWINEFKEGYKHFNRDKTLPESVVMLHAAATLYASLTSHRAILQTIRRNLRGTDPIPEDERRRLLIVIESNLTFEQFVIKASAINNAYVTIAELLGVDLCEQRLSIIKVESGSGWFDLLGDPRVVTVLTSIASAAMTYFITKFTRDGKIATIPRDVNAADSVLELTKKMEAEGFEMTEAKENVKNAIVKIAKDMNELLEGEPVVRIGTIRHAVGPEMERRLLEARTQKALGYTLPSNSDTPAGPA